MQELKVKGKLLLGALVVLAIAAPLACSSDDNGNKVAAAGGEAGEAGSPETAGTGGSTAQGGKGGAGGKAGTAGTAGSTGVAGSTVVGEGGVANSPGADAGGEAGMASEAGAPGAVVDAAYQANLDAACTTQAALDCSATAMPASDKQACLDSFNGLFDFAPNCTDSIKAYVACLAPMPGSSYTCSDSAAYPNDNVCADTSSAMVNCFPQ